MRSYFLVLSILTSFGLFSQLNMTYVGNITYDQELSDIWGYAAPDGSEYAIVGLYNGVSVVDVTDPETPTELFFFPGANSIWRDIKTWDGYAYVTNESSNGVMVIDLTQLPANASAYNWTPNIPGYGNLSSCHNIWIDEFGYAYLVGCNLNSGGMIYVDCFTEPGVPVVAGVGPSVYAHDVFTRNNVAYSSEVYQGVFSIYDVSDKNSTQILGSQETGGNFTHNAWLSDNDQYLFTTDEISNGPVGSYDVSDPTDVQELDQFRPLETLGEGVIPHNVHVWDDWIIISYYTDGCIIVDGSNPGNLVEVGNFDTFIPTSSGFNGAWGAYPFLPSGLVLVSDIGNGMYVLEPNYVRACWLEGTVSDAVSGLGLVGASLVLESTIVTELSGNQGAYATGYAIAGTYQVTVSKPGYEPQTVEVQLDNGVITELDVELQPFESFALAGIVISNADGTAVPNALIELNSPDFIVNAEADGSGQFSLDGVFPDTYEVTVGAWGYVTECFELEVTGNTTSLEFTLDEGYYDDFSLDFGWTSSFTSPTGHWVRVEPLGTTYFNSPSNPSADVAGDCQDKAYVTGNAEGSVGNDDVDDGFVMLVSPFFEVNLANNPTISYKRWFANYDDTVSDDELIISLVNEIGADFPLDEVNAAGPLGQWVLFESPLADVLTDDGNYRLKVLTSDNFNNGSIVEAGIDEFRIDQVLSLSEVNELPSVSIFPNPSSSEFIIDLGDISLDDASIVLTDLRGRVVLTKAVNQAIVRIDESLEVGTYVIQVIGRKGEMLIYPTRLVKL